MDFQYRGLSRLHDTYWPPGQSRKLSLSQTNLSYNVEVAAARFPDKPFIVFYDATLTFGVFKDETERVAGYLQQDCGVQAGDRVLLYMQNSPQWIIAYYGILRANAVVVPVNPMNLTDELRHFVDDSEAKVAIVPQDRYAQIAPLVGDGDGNGNGNGNGNGAGRGIRHVLVAAYSDYLGTAPHTAPPPFVSAPREAIAAAGVTLWCDMLAMRRAPGPLTTGPDDLCVMPYTSGTTGQPKGCMHTHRSVMATLVGGVNWFGSTPDTVHLSALPFFHVTGMQGGMNGPLYAGATIVVLPRWDRDAAARSIGRYRITAWQCISTMMVDFLSNPRLDEYDLSTLTCVRGGGAAMPDAIVAKLRNLTGLEFVEGYGMSETIAATHINPPHRPKAQCLGIPVYEVDARIVDPASLVELARGETGEIVVHGPQIMRGYWRNPQATRDAFVEIGGKAFLRTGDLGRVDEDGYFFMIDRLKRMINASGFKVWPAEVETLMYRHPAIQEVCVVGMPDAHRGETVKALVVLQPAQAGRVGAQDVIDWARDNMAAYKAPCVVEFVSSLPKSATGKILWRQLQDLEAERAASSGARTS